jgi:hypothetical protein
MPLLLNHCSLHNFRNVILGNEVKTIVNDFKSAGTYMDEIDSNELSSGSYFLNLKSNKGSITKKITILK